MKRLRRGVLLVSAVLVLAHCKGKASSSGGSEGAGGTAASATASASPAPSASTPPSALSTLMGFEGEIDMTARAADTMKPPQPINMLVKGDKIRFDVIPGTDVASSLGGKAYMLVRTADKKIDVVAEVRKQVVELDLSNPEVLKGLQKAGGPAGHPAKPEPAPKLAKTGTKETIAGYSCEDWEVTSAKDNKKKASMCVADLPSTFFHIPLTGMPADYGFTLELVDGKHFPLRFVGYDEHTGAESGRLEVTKLDPHPVDASKFDIPAGYQTVDMMQMLSGLTGGHIPGAPSAMPGMPGNLPGQPHPHHTKH
jgi:hypothetical protein